MKKSLMSLLLVPAWIILVIIFKLVGFLFPIDLGGMLMALSVFVIPLLVLISSALAIKIIVKNEPGKKSVIATLVVYGIIVILVLAYIVKGGDLALMH